MKEIVGRKFGLLTVISYHSTQQSHTKWECLCECGKTTIVYRQHLVGGTTQSCGCGRVKHNKKGTRLYRIWCQMKARCNNTNHGSFHNYGGRGIKVCDRWQDFNNFYEDMSESHEHHCTKYGEIQTTLERINNDSDYAPHNCKWATLKEQRRNNRVTKFYSYKGTTITSGEISDKYGIKYETIESRLRRGWTIEKIIETPVHRQYARRNKRVQSKSGA